MPSQDSNVLVVSPLPGLNHRLKLGARWRNRDSASSSAWRGDMSLLPLSTSLSPGTLTLKPILLPAPRLFHGCSSGASSVCSTSTTASIVGDSFRQARAMDSSWPNQDALWQRALAMLC